MFPHPETYSEREVTELITARVEHINRTFKTETNMLMTTAHAAELPPKFYKKYEDLFPKEVQEYHINNLKTIGLIDPFAEEEETSIAVPGELPQEVDGVLP